MTTTKERLSTMETKVDTIKCDIAEIKKDLKETNKNINLFIQYAPDRFAAKQIEKEFRTYEKNADCRFDKIEKRMAYFSGGVAIIFLVIQLAMKFWGI
jgi:hypothetical protein